MDRFKDAVLRPWQQELVDRLRSETGDYYIFHADVTKRAGKSWLMAWAHTQPDIITLPFSLSITKDLFERVESGWKGIILLETTSARSDKRRCEHNEKVLKALLDVKQGFLQVGKKHKTIEPPQICVLADVWSYGIYGCHDQHIIECCVKPYIISKMGSHGKMEQENIPGVWATKWNEAVHYA